LSGSLLGSLGETFGTLCGHLSHQAPSLLYVLIPPRRPLPVKGLLPHQLQQYVGHRGGVEAVASPLHLLVNLRKGFGFPEEAL
jgi:hypothetical protein